MSELKMKSVDDALSSIIGEYLEFRDEKFLFIRIQNIARRMHRFYWKYRGIILNKIQEWVKNHPQGSVYVDNMGRKWKVGYGEQMSYIYGCFFDRKENLNMLELYRLSKGDEHGG